MSRKYLIVLPVVIASFIAATTIQYDWGGSHNIDAKTKEEVYRVLDEFLRTFNAHDREGHYATYHFPHYRLASGKLTVLEKPNLTDTAVFVQRLVQSGWHHTKWDHRNVVQASKDKIHVDVQFTRYRADGSKIKTYESLYILTNENNRWAIKMRSSFAE